MQPAVMSPETWGRLPPYQRDAVRIGFIGYTPPENAGRWPETEFGWRILLGRYANQRRVDALWTTDPVPVTTEERTAIGAYEAWKVCGNSAFELAFLAPRKKDNRSPEKVLTGEKRKRKSVFNEAVLLTRRVAESFFVKLEYLSSLVLPAQRV